jgi:hypothetical protein
VRERHGPRIRHNPNCEGIVPPWAAVALTWAVLLASRSTRRGGSRFGPRAQWVWILNTSQSSHP